MAHRASRGLHYSTSNRGESGCCADRICPHFAFDHPVRRHRLRICSSSRDGLEQWTAREATILVSLSHVQGSPNLRIALPSMKSRLRAAVRSRKFRDLRPLGLKIEPPACGQESNSPACRRLTFAATGRSRRDSLPMSTKVRFPITLLSQSAPAMIQSSAPRRPHIAHLACIYRPVACSRATAARAFRKCSLAACTNFFEL